MTEFTNGHPEYDQLLALMDRDLPEGSRDVRRHARECGKCRQEIDEYHAAVWDYGQYEEALVLPAIPPAPHPWLDLRQALRQVEESRDPRPASRVTAGLADSVGRLVAGGAALGCLAFAIVLVSRVEKQPVEKVATPGPAAAITSPVSHKLDSPKAGNGRRSGPVDAGPLAVESSLNTEVRVFAALHRLGADLGEPVEIGSSADGKVAVGGTGLAPERQVEIREALAKEPGVVIRFTDQARRPVTTEEATRLDAGHSSLEARLSDFAGGQAAYESLSNAALDESDAVVARAHALRTLEQRFPTAQRSKLHEAERRTLDAMTAAHRAAFDEHARTLLLLIEPLSEALGTPAPAAVKPQGALEAAQRMDRVLSAIFGAARTGLTSDQLLAALSNASAALSAALGDRK
jgi:hypothetical protein